MEVAVKDPSTNPATAAEQILTKRSTPAGDVVEFCFTLSTSAFSAYYSKCGILLGEGFRNVY